MSPLTGLARLLGLIFWSVHMGNFIPVDRDEIQERKPNWWNINLYHQRIKQLDKQCSDLVRKLSSLISQEHFDALSKVISHNANKLKEKVKNRHSRKLTDMGAFVADDQYVDKKRWVINLSNR